MRISVITITCRENPRLADMAKTLAASLERAPDVELEWIVVDERERQDRPVRIADMDRFTVVYTKPNPSKFRVAEEKTPAHNSARNAGLEKATGDYVVFLNDCALVTQDWMSVAADCAAQNMGWRCKAHVVHDISIAPSGIVRMKDHHDRLRPIPANTVPGVCWGAPMDAFVKIGGFDTAYDGEDKGHDLDAVIRLSRVGINFVTTERAFCVRLKRTRTKTEISTRKEAFNGTRNLKLVQRLVADKDRILPLGPGQAGLEPAPRAPAPRPPRVVLSNQNYPRLAGTAQSAAKRPPRALPNVSRPAGVGNDPRDVVTPADLSNLPDDLLNGEGDEGDDLAGLLD